ncbi:MAG: MBL fold metallo-hydrolase [Verrucomicrobia bacterium]|nr:MBL fold metallo-hydrolase [Verrucomicrobiota bacterium]NDE63853.1 MBL fold metallo-hydrolase [Chlamydiota bacterium]
MRSGVRIPTSAFSFMQIIDKILGPLETRTILLICPTTFESILIDPSFYSHHYFAPILEEKNFLLKKVYLTHSHYDHIVDIAKFHQMGIDIFVHLLDSQNVIAPGSDGLRALKAIEGVSNPKFFKEGDVIRFGQIKGVVLETPGHSPGSCCFYFPDHHVLISGDTLFKGGIGRLDLPTAEPDKMGVSLDKIKKLPKNTIIYPGHGPKTTIQEEL